MSFVAEFITYGIVDAIIEAILWGSFGFLFFRLIKFRARSWHIEIIFLTAFYSLWSYWGDNIFLQMDITIQNREILELFDNDPQALLRFDPTDILINFIQIGLGYVCARILFNKTLKNQL